MQPEPKEHQQPLVSDNLHVCPSAQLSPDDKDYADDDDDNFNDGDDNDNFDVCPSAQLSPDDKDNSDGMAFKTLSQKVARIDPCDRH